MTNTAKVADMFYVYRQESGAGFDFMGPMARKEADKEFEKIDVGDKEFAGIVAASKFNEHELEWLNEYKDVTKKGEWLGCSIYDYEELVEKAYELEGLKCSVEEFMEDEDSYEKVAKHFPVFYAPYRFT